MLPWWCARSHTLRSPSIHCKSFTDAEEGNLALNVVLLYFSVPFKHPNEMKISPNCGLFIVFFFSGQQWEISMKKINKNKAKINQSLLFMEQKLKNTVWECPQTWRHLLDEKQSETRPVAYDTTPECANTWMTENLLQHSYTTVIKHL